MIYPIKICSVIVEGENVQKTGYVRSPDVLEARVWSDGNVEIVTRGKVSPEEVVPLVRLLGSLARSPEHESEREAIVHDVPGVVVLPRADAKVEARLSPDLYPMIVERLVVPDHVAPNFLVTQVMFGDLPMLRPSLSVSATGFVAGESPAIELTIGEGLEIAFTVMNLAYSPQEFTFRVEGRRVREVAGS
jgi:hypothetical protein